MPQRTRVKPTEVVIVPGNYKATDHAGNVTANITYNEKTFEQDESMIDTVDQNFAFRRAQGEIFNNLMIKNFSLNTRTLGDEKIKWPSSKATTEHSGRTMCYYRRTAPGTWSSPPADYFPLWATNLDNLLNQCKQQAIANIDRTPYAFLEDLFEAHKTLKLLANPMKESVILSNIFDKAYKRLLKKMSPAQAFSKAWLEVRYGWRPIMISTQNILLAAKDPRSSAPVRRTSRSLKKGKDSFTEVLVKTIGSGRTHTFTHSQRADYTASAGILYEIDNPLQNSGFTWKYGLRKKDVLPTLWNIMPYAFVVDWFLDINATIKGIQNLNDPHLNILASWVKYESNTNEDWYMSAFTPETGWTITGFTPTSESFTKRTIARVPWKPETADVLPPYKGATDLSSFKAIDLAAIAYNILTKKRA